MLLAVALMVATLAVVASVVVPLVRTARPGPARAAFDRAVYRAQLEDLERDVARGVIARPEASTTRLEIERRLLASDTRTAAPAPAQAASPVLAIVLALAIPTAAALVYLAQGSPGVPDHPFGAANAETVAGNAAPGHTDFAAAAARLEQQLKEHPEDAQKWLLLAHTQAELGSWQKSADAYHRVIELTGGNAEAFTGYGEMLVMGAQGVVTPAARTAFETALKQDRTDEVARFYMSLGDAQAGDTRQAIDGWLKLAADLPEDSMIRAEIKRRVEEAAKSEGIALPAFPPPAKPAAEAAPAGVDTARGPTSQDVAAVESMSPEDRQALVRSMVARLADRLKSEPNDLDGWLRLGRAYGVLGQRDEAIDAYEHADRLLPPGSDQHREIGAAIDALKAK